MKNLLAFFVGGLLVLSAAYLVLLGMYIADVRDDRKRHVIVSGPSPIFSTESCFPQVQDRIATTAVGEPINVRRVHYPKECMIVRVHLKSGIEGFMVSGEGAWKLE